VADLTNPERRLGGVVDVLDGADLLIGVPRRGSSRRRLWRA
jgi:hypothetical protein